MESGDRTVLSEVHWHVTRSSEDGGITRFAVKRPREETAVSKEVVEDKDGDLEPPRKKCKNPSEVYTVTHKLHTPLEHVGFQVWSGCLLLADYLLHNEVSLRGKVILELGCGCGLAGLVARRAATTCYLTDYDDEILKNCEKNVASNDHLISKGTTRVRKLDWTWCPGPFPEYLRDYKGPFQWEEEDMGLLKEDVLVIGADLVYSEDLTDALFKHLGSILGDSNIFILALEKRINFSLEELADTSKAYDHFLSYLNSGGRDDEETLFRGRRVDVSTLPRYFEYDRVEELELWEIVKKKLTLRVPETSGMTSIK